MVTGRKWMLVCAAVGALGCNDLGGAKPQTIEALSNRVQDPAALWTFREGYGTIVHDQSGALPLPLDLVFTDSKDVEWFDGGLRILNPTIAYPTAPADNITAPCMATNEMSMEVWAYPKEITQNGTFMTHGRAGDAVDETNDYDFELDQTTTAVQAIVRSTGSPGGDPHANSGPDRLAPGIAHHIVATWSAVRADIFINGSPTQSTIIGGDFSNWGPKKADPYQFLGFNNVHGNNGFVGEVYLMAVYCRALTSAEIMKNYTAGYN